MKRSRREDSHPKNWEHQGEQQRISRPSSWAVGAVAAFCSIAATAFVSSHDFGVITESFGASSASPEIPYSQQETPPAAVSGATRPSVIRVGLMAFTSEGDYSTHVEAEDRMLSRMGELLNEQISQFRFDARFYRMDALQEAVRTEKVDLFLASSGFFWEMQRKYGARDLATLITDKAPDPNAGVAGVIFVRKDRRDLQTLGDLEGKRLAAGRANMFLAYQLAMGEIAASGHDPEDFFSSVREDDLPAETVVPSVLRGDVDVGFLRACVLEYRYPDWRDSLRIVSPKEHDSLACAHSSALYPNWTLGATSKVPPEVLKSVAGTLLSLPKMEGESTWSAWSLATDFKHVDELEASLRIGRYAYLKDWSWEGIWKRFGLEIILAGSLLAALLLHLWRVERLVDKRTAALTEEMARRRKLEEEAEAVRDRVEKLERTQIVGQLSTMIAHDLKQPLAAVGYFVDGLTMLVKKGKIDCAKLLMGAERIRAQIERMNAIVEQVRSYAKREDRRDAMLDLGEVIRKSASESRIPPEIPTYIEGPVLQVKGCALELEAAFVNLIRNAIEAQRGKDAVLLADGGRPFIRIRWSYADGNAVIRIENNTPPVTQSMLDEMRLPLVTGKEEGLGLGLQIVSSIIEAHAGTFELCVESSSSSGPEAEQKKFKCKEGELGSRVTAIVTLPCEGDSGSSFSKGTSAEP